MSVAATLLSGLRDALARAGGGWRENRAGEPRCAACAYFRDDPAYVEATIPGLASMSSGHASVRSGDGICVRLDRYLSGDAHCGHFAAAAGTTGIGCPPL